MARRRREPETARINAVTHDGRGIAAVSGKKVFVSGALAGEEVRFLRRKSRRKFDEAELLEVLERSADRIEMTLIVRSTLVIQRGCNLVKPFGQVGHRLRLFFQRHVGHAVGRQRALRAPDGR